ncbi:hypothetical protein MSHI_23230 [Mycobacterium shinjukuense]|uniref:Uncharacterized protein n=1 Tax=Mycobacterium shinjukuense TaxID=398694 RepID=A0A7I7MRH6_9MYCO|nr:hypothetical protein MSHI_23230 [Mycobacterium shinjukuense]
MTGWHDRRWAHHLSVMRETIECLRVMLAGTRVDYLGRTGWVPTAKPAPIAWRWCPPPPKIRGATRACAR